MNFSWRRGGFRRGDLECQLVGRPVRSHKHGAAVVASTKGCTEFTEPFAQPGNLSLLLAQRLCLTGHLGLQSLQLCDTQFQSGDLTVAIVEQLRLLRQFGKTSIPCGEIIFEGVQRPSMLRLFFAQLDFQPVDTPLSRFELCQLAPEPINLAKPVV